MPCQIGWKPELIWLYALLEIFDTVVPMFLSDLSIYLCGATS